MTKFYAFLFVWTPKSLTLVYEIDIVVQNILISVQLKYETMRSCLMFLFNCKKSLKYLAKEKQITC